MRFSVECAFPHLGKRRAASRKSAFCALGLTEKCSLHPAPHGKAHSVRERSRRVRLSARSDPKPKFGGPGATRPAAWRAVALRPPPGDDVNEKAQSARWTSRKSALCAHRLTERRSLSPPLPQNASFREIVPPECAFPYGTGCRMRFSVECAFPHLGKRRAASRKSALCALGLTEKRILCSPPHGKAHSVRERSRRVRLSVRPDPKSKFGAPAQPAPQPGGRLLGRVCPVGPLSIVPRILAGGCLAPPPGDDVTERHTLYASH